MVWRLVLSFYFICFVGANLRADDSQISISPVDTTTTEASNVEDVTEAIQVADDTKRNENATVDAKETRRQLRILYYQGNSRQIWQNKKQQYLDGKHQTDSIDYLSLLKLVLSLLQDVRRNPVIIKQLIAEISTEILTEIQTLPVKNQIKAYFVKSLFEKFQNQCGLTHGHFASHPQCSTALNTLRDSYFDFGKYLQYILDHKNQNTLVQEKDKNSDLNSLISIILNNLQQPTEKPNINLPNNPAKPENPTIQVLIPESQKQTPNYPYVTQKPKESYWWDIHDTSEKPQQADTYKPYATQKPKGSYWWNLDDTPKEPHQPGTHRPWLPTDKSPQDDQSEDDIPWSPSNKYPQEPEQTRPWLPNDKYQEEEQQPVTYVPWLPTDKYPEDEQPVTYAPWLPTDKYPQEPLTYKPWVPNDEASQDEQPVTYVPWLPTDKYPQGNNYPLEPQQPLIHKPWLPTEIPQNEQPVTYVPWLPTDYYPQETKQPETYKPWLPTDKSPQDEQPVTHAPWLPTDKYPEEPQKPVTYAPWLPTEKPSEIVSSPSTTETNAKKNEIENYIHQIISEQKINDNIDNVFNLIKKNRPVFKPQLYDILFALLDAYKTGAIDSQRFNEIFEFLIRPHQIYSVWDEEKAKYLWQFLQPDTSGHVNTNNLNLILKLIRVTKQNPYSINILSQILPFLQTSKEKPNDSRVINAILALLDADKKLSPQQANLLISLIRPDQNGQIPPKNLDLIAILTNLDQNPNLNADDIKAIFSLLKPNSEGRVDEKVVEILYDLLAPGKTKNLRPEDFHKILYFLKESIGKNKGSPKRLDIVLFILNNTDQASVTNSLIPLLDDDIENLKNINILLYLNSKGLRNAQVFNDLINASKEEKKNGVVEPSKVLSQLEPHLRTEPDKLIDILKLLRPNNAPEELPLLIYLLSKGINPYKDDDDNKYVTKPKVNDYDWLYKLFQEPQWSVQNPSPVTPKPKENDFIELTYKIKAQKPVLYHPVHYVKYKIPLKTFLANAKVLLAQNPRLLADPAQLLQKLIIEKNTAEISPNLLGYPEHDNILKFTYVDGELVNAKVLAENTLKVNNQIKPHDIYSDSDITPQEILLLNQNNADYNPSKAGSEPLKWPFLLGSRSAQNLPEVNRNVTADPELQNWALSGVDPDENTGDLDIINEAGDIYDPTPVEARFGINEDHDQRAENKQESVDSNTNDVRPLRLTRINTVEEPKEVVKKPQERDGVDLTV